MLTLLPLVALAYLALSPICYAVYAHDKKAAKLGAYRVPESTLLTLGLLGGWPGGLLAQRRLRHKTRKQSFQLAFWLTVMLNVFGVVVLIGYLATS